MSLECHRQSAAGISVGCAVITLSDTRTTATDVSGAAIQRLLSDAGHKTVDYRIIPDDSATLDALLAKLLGNTDVQAILTNGGTGISRRDRTMEVVRRRLEIPIDGFGELFRMLSWQEIGSGAMLSRAAGGIARGRLIFSMPGSTKAVELAMTKLILPELGHLVGELRK
jgi:molybdenum cofactor biosynthesis protein B